MNEKKFIDQEVTGPELLESTKRLILFVNESIVNCRPVSPRIYDYARSLAVCISPLLVKDLWRIRSGKSSPTAAVFAIDSGTTSMNFTQDIARNIRGRKSASCVFFPLFAIRAW